MPLYEYKCNSCGKVFEVIQKFSDEPLTTHAECGGAVERLLSAPAFHLKGTGWYATDYAKGSGVKPSEPKPGDGKSDSASKSDSGSSGSESKTETKSTTSEAKPAAASTSDAK